MQKQTVPDHIRKKKSFAVIVMAAACVFLCVLPAFAQTRHFIEGVPHLTAERPKFCLIASCDMVLKYYRYQVSQDDIADCDEKDFFKEQGVYADELVKFLRRRGVRARAFRGDVRFMQQFIKKDMPVIALFLMRADQQLVGHAVVVIGYDRRADTVIYIEPSDGMERIVSEAEFTEVFQNSMVVIYPQ